MVPMYYSLFSYLCAVSYYEGIHAHLDQIIDWMKFETEADYDKLRQRLAAVPNRVSDQSKSCTAPFSKVRFDSDSCVLIRWIKKLR